MFPQSIQIEPAVTLGDKAEKVPYDPFEHLCRSLFKSEDALFFMLTAYFDDSNTSPNQKVAVVAGYLGSVSQWERFRHRWAALLEEFEIEITHRTDLQNLKKDFSTWDEQRRDAFVSKAYGIINRFTYVPIGAAVSTEDFNAIVPKHMKTVLGGVYGFCAYVCVSYITEWCNRHNYKDKIQYVFEDGTYGRGQVNEWFRVIIRSKELRERYLYGGISFQTKELEPLQAADFVAYDLGRYALDVRLGRQRADVFRIYEEHVLGKKSESSHGIRYLDHNLLKPFFDKFPPKEAMKRT